MGEPDRRYFHWLDYTILGLSLVGALGVGIYQAWASKRKRTTDEYLMGSRRFSIIPVALSLIASFISSIGLIGVPAEIHYYGVQSVFSMVSLFFASVISSQVFVPLFLPLKITSSTEYLQLRYKSRSVRLLGASIFSLSLLFYTGCVVYGQAAALEATTGLPSHASIILVNVLGTIYTSCGGMTAVIWTDVFQICIMFVSMVMVVVMGLIHVGGFGAMWNYNNDWGRIFIDFDPSLYKRLSIWSTIISGCVGFTGTYGISQTAVQRFCAVGTVAKARKDTRIFPNWLSQVPLEWCNYGRLYLLLYELYLTAFYFRTMIVNAIGKFVFAMICCLVGLITFAFYAKQGCDPYASGRIPNKNQIIPLFVMDVLPYPGVPGIFFAGLFSGSLSTISSSITSQVAITWVDVLKPLIKHDMTENRRVTINQVVAASWGIAGLAMTFAVYNVGGSLLQISKALWGISAGPGLGIFILGALFPWTNWIGALTGALTTIAFITWMFIGQNYLGIHSVALPIPSDSCPSTNSTANATITTPSFFTTTDIGTQRTFLEEWLYSISFMWFAVIGLAMCISVGLIVSFLTGATDPLTVEKRLLFHFMRGRYGKEEEKEAKQKVLTEPLMEKKLYA